MLEVRNKIEGNVVVSEDTALYGMYVGPVTAMKNIKFICNGMIVGTLYVEQDSLVIIKGMVTKDIINNGGRLEIFGIVKGRIINLSGDLFIDPQAIVSEVVNELVD